MLRERALSAAIFVPPLVLVIVLGNPWLSLLIGLMVVLGSLEAFRLLRDAGYGVLPVLGLAAALAIVVDAAAATQLAGTGLLLTAVALILIAAGAFSRPDPRVGLSTWAATTFGALYVGLLAFVIRLGEIVPALPPGAPAASFGAERGWVLLLVLAVWAFDTGAYLVGRRFGRHRFLTHLSASKTLEGVAGGLVGATLVAVAGLWALGEPWPGGLLLGPLLGLAAQAGDLAESMLKRAAGAKDSGTLIPGHGGILDRIDSFLFAAPVVTLYAFAFVR
ncbi:MAG: phosphatidate cytidylyltransferase [Chloroflexi bacterium]|nr:phosphatidate cytidylyltransferase [Chloroflexota bacterium]